MPVYDSKCRSCGGLAQYLSTVEDRYSIPPCPGCGGERSKIILTAPKGFVKGNFTPFKSPVDGSLISTNKDLAEHNKRNNVVNTADGYSDEAIRKGNIVPKKTGIDKKDLANDVGEALHKLKQGYVPPPREAHNE
jgi:putative FmdB family regulatory protein